MRYEGRSWEEISSKLERNIGAITPFLTRSHQYFRSLLCELIQGFFSLSDETQTLIQQDLEDKFKKTLIRLPERSDGQEIPITFQELILTKLQNPGLNWSGLAQNLEISPSATSDLITFHLVSISSFKRVFQDEFNL